VEITTLSPKALRQIRDLVRKDVLQAARAVRQPPLVEHFTTDVYLAETPAGGIPALTANVAGSAQCGLKSIADDGTVTDVTNSTGSVTTVTVYNVASNAVDGSTLIQCKRELASGRLLADFEDC